MTYRRISILILVSVLLFLIGCAKTATVNVDVTPENSGQIIGVGEYEVGSTVYLQAQPSEGYVFSGWEKNNSIIEDQNEYDFNIKSNENLVANFEKEMVEIKVNVNDSTMGFITGDGTYSFNEPVLLKAHPKENYKFIGWFNTDDGIVSSELELEIVANTNQKYVAKFEPAEFTIKLQSTIKEAKLYGEGSYKKGKKQFIRAEKLHGYRFSHWEGENGEVFSKKDGQMITVDKNLNLTAIYEKKEQAFYLGFSQDELFNKINQIYQSFFYIMDQRYYLHYDPDKENRISKTLVDALKNGDYYIDLNPSISIQNLIEDITHEVKVNDNKIIVNSSINIPQIKNTYDINEIKSEYINNIDTVLDYDEFLSKYLQYDENKINKYNHEIHFIKKNDELIMTHIDQTADIFADYKKIYKKVFLDQIDSIDIHVNDNAFMKMTINYDGDVYELNYNSDIFDNRALYSKINFIIDDTFTINFEKLKNTLRKNIEGSLIVDSQLFDNLKFYNVKDKNQLLIEIGFSYGMNLSTIYSFYDFENNRFSFSEKIEGSVIEDSLQFSKNHKFMSFLLGDSSTRKTLEIINLESKERIKLIDLMKDQNINKKATPIFKNETWDPNDNKIEFEYYSYITESGHKNEKTINEGKFLYDLNTNKISRITEDVDEYEDEGKPVTILKYNPYEEKGLISAEIPNSINQIGDWAFYGNNLTSVKIPDSVTSIGVSAFYNNDLKSLEIPDSVTSIGVSAFYNNNLISVEIPDSVIKIGESAFFNNNLESVIIPDSITSISNFTFENNNLKTIEIPNSVKIIGESAFASNNLKSVEIPDSVTSVGNWAFSNNKIQSLIISNSVTKIGGYAFSRNSIASVKIPNSVTYIDHGAFDSNDITEVEIPSGCNYEDSSFDDNVKIIQK